MLERVRLIERRDRPIDRLWTPDIGIFGNTHFLYLDLNNVQIADLVSDFMKKTGLDGRGNSQ